MALQQKDRMRHSVEGTPVPRGQLRFLREAKRYLLENHGGARPTGDTADEGGLNTRLWGHRIAAKHHTVLSVRDCPLLYLQGATGTQVSGWEELSTSAPCSLYWSS